MGNEGKAMPMDRAYVTLNVKAVEENGKRIIRGTASTPNPDRMNDIVVPEGAEFNLPIPLLWQHNHDQPIGNVIAATVNTKGITMEAEIASTDILGPLKDFLDNCWQQIQLKLVRGLSIGFNPKEYSFIDNGGIKFSIWEWLELSCVTIPANVDGTITSIKSIDRAQMAALGLIKQTPVVKLNPPGATGNGKKTKPQSNPQRESNMNILEQIENFRKQKADLHEKMTAIMTKAADEGRTLDESEVQDYDGCQAEMESIDKHLPRLEALQKSIDTKSVTRAQPVQGDSANDGANSRGPAPGNPNLVVRNTQKLEKGVEFARFAQCLAAAKGSLSDAYAIAQNRYPQNENVVNSIKAAVAAGTTTDPTWAGPLLEYNTLVSDFIDYLRPATILGKFGLNGIPALNRIPFNVHIKGQTSGGAGYWVGQGKAKPLTSFAFNDIYLGWTKVANIAVLTEDLLRFSNPSADTLTRNALAAALIERLDIDFIDPNKAAVANVSPASITNGLTPIHASGTNANAVRADIARLWAPFITNNISPTTAVYIMSPMTALKLSLMRNDLGQAEFPNITINGGTLEGIPVITSNYIPTVTAGSLIILANAEDIFLADDGTVTIDASREASLQMDSAPTMDSTTPTGTQVVSMFQTNSVALRAERYINWMKRRAQAVAYLDQVEYA
jgi:HK97 family phage major capsid protein/HK97 family phage prohead protease